MPYAPPPSEVRQLSDGTRVVWAHAGDGGPLLHMLNSSFTLLARIEMERNLYKGEDSFFVHGTEKLPIGNKVKLEVDSLESARFAVETMYMMVLSAKGDIDAATAGSIVTQLRK